MAAEDSWEQMGWGASDNEKFWDLYKGLEVLRARQWHDLICVFTNQVLWLLCIEREAMRPLKAEISRGWWEHFKGKERRGCISSSSKHFTATSPGHQIWRGKWDPLWVPCGETGGFGWTAKDSGVPSCACWWQTQSLESVACDGLSRVTEAHWL